MTSCTLANATAAQCLPHGLSDVSGQTIRRRLGRRLPRENGALGRRPCGVGINLVTGVPGGWVQYISLSRRTSKRASYWKK